MGWRFIDRLFGRAERGDYPENDIGRGAYAVERKGEREQSVANSEIPFRRSRLSTSRTKRSRFADSADFGRGSWG